MTMGAKANSEQAARIHGILGRITPGEPPDHSPYYGHADWQEAKALTKAIAGYTPTCGGATCRYKVQDILRQAVGLGVARKPAKSEKTAERIAICHGCKAYNETTGACGRLILDAISAKPIEDASETIYPCGCLVSLKARFELEKCPAQKW